MARYDEIAVDDTNSVGAVTYVRVGVDEGDDVIDLNTADETGALAQRLTISEALTTIAKLTEAVQVALQNT